MFSHRLFTDQSLSIDSTIILSGKAANYVGRALRARKGDAITLFNGDGNNYRGQVVAVDKMKVRVRVESLERSKTEMSFPIEIGLCLSRQDRLDWAIQKTTELGVHIVTPLISERIRFQIPTERLAKRQRHWQQVAISASEQCGRARIPEINQPKILQDWTERNRAEAKFILHRDAIESIDTDEPPSSLAILIGPESGLTTGEVTFAVSHGFRKLSLGPRILRTETAPIAALAIFGAKWGDIMA